MYEANICNECICIQVFSQGSDGKSASACLGKCTKQMSIKPGVLHTAACVYACVSNQCAGLDEMIFAFSALILKQNLCWEYYTLKS